MQLGFNTNVKHKGLLFHVQTEDSGTARPHVITHLYFKGTILASEKRGYAELVGVPDLKDRVRGLMDEQHKAMARRLTAGEFDAIIAQRLQPDPPGELADSRGDTQPGANTPPLAAQPPAPQAAKGAVHEATTTVPDPRPFGTGIVSDQPLDELILEYLVENARKRKRK